MPNRFPISDADLARVRRRHANIEQDPLPLDWSDLPAPQKSQESRQLTQPSVRFVKCPKHVPSGRSELTGVIRRSDGVEVFRSHNMVVGAHRVPCPGSGEVAPAGVVIP